MVKGLLADIFARMLKKRWLSRGKQRVRLETLIRLAQTDLLKAIATVPEDHPTLSERALILNVIEFFDQSMRRWRR
jgi:hypothetical protein